MEIPLGCVTSGWTGRDWPLQIGATVDTGQLAPKLQWPCKRFRTLMIRCYQSLLGRRESLMNDNLQRGVFLYNNNQPSSVINIQVT